MGYEKPTLKKLIDVCKEVFPSLEGLAMLELGDQAFYNYDDLLPYFAEFSYQSTGYIAKPFFEHLGFKHTSIDYNGLNGAINLDVRKDLSGILPRFDVLTNLGFTEHV